MNSPSQSLGTGADDNRQSHWVRWELPLPSPSGEPQPAQKAAGRALLVGDPAHANEKPFISQRLETD